MHHRCRLRSETRWAEFGYFLCYFKMVAPRALVFRPLVKGNEDSGNETGNGTKQRTELFFFLNSSFWFLSLELFTCGGTKTGELGEKPSEQGEKEQQTQPTYDTGPESNTLVGVWRAGRGGGAQALSPLRLPPAPQKSTACEANLRALTIPLAFPSPLSIPELIH